MARCVAERPWSGLRDSDLLVVEGVVLGPGHGDACVSLLGLAHAGCQRAEVDLLAVILPDLESWVEVTSLNARLVEAPYLP